MKKAYVKPEVYFESFELNTSIASCDYTDGKTFNIRGVCGWDDGVRVVFLENVSACKVHPQEDEYPDICYDVFANMLFGS